MGLLNLFRKKGSKTDAPASGDELNSAVAGILAIEARRDKAAADLERAKKALAAEYAQNIAVADDAEPSPAPVVEAQCRLDALERLLRDAKAEAMGTVAKCSAAHRERRAAVEAELQKTRRGIDERRVQTIAEFCGRHGLSIQWPSQNNGGFIVIPALKSFETEMEIRELAAPATAARQPDPEEGRLKELAAERLRLDILTGAAPDIALDSVVAEARRR